jgi:hypothetical protein
VAYAHARQVPFDCPHAIPGIALAPAPHLNAPISSPEAICVLSLPCHASSPILARRASRTLDVFERDSRINAFPSPAVSTISGAVRISLLLSNISMLW